MVTIKGGFINEVMKYSLENVWDVYLRLILISYRIPRNFCGMYISCFCTLLGFSGLNFTGCHTATGLVFSLQALFNYADQHSGGNLCKAWSSLTVFIFENYL